MFRAKLALVIQVHVVAFAAFGVVSCQGKGRTPHRYLIPDGYVGWVRVDFGVEGTSEIARSDSFYVFRIPKSGLLRTSSKLNYGVASDEYYYYAGDTLRRLPITQSGAGGMIWSGFNGSSTQGPNEHVYEYFFVGTEQQFEALGKRDLSPGGRPQVGNQMDKDNETDLPSD
jgi:hypothetical protein